MANTVAFESRTAKLNKSIEVQIDKIIGESPFRLPTIDDEISRLYVNKIEGTYNVDRAKKDTDNAIDLLYIAYNTTTQKEGEIRTKIVDIMNRLIKSQQESEIAMSRAMNVSDFIVGKVGANHAEWLDVRSVQSADNTKGVDEIKEFLKNDLLTLARQIKEKALGVKKELDVIAASYDGIIKNTADVTSSSEKALASQLKDKAAMEKEIVESNARREQLDALVKDLQSEVQKYDKMARDYESRANTAEERAFIMSIVQIGAQMLAGALPAIVTALTASATGGASVVASAATNTLKRAVGDKNSDTKGDADDDQKAIATRKEIAEKKATTELSEKKVAELKGDLKNLNDELKKEQGKETSEKEKDATGKESKDKETKDVEEKEKEITNKDTETVKGLKTRIEEKRRS